MKIAIIGRSELLFETTIFLQQTGYDIVGILTAKEAPEYTKTNKDYKDLAESWKIPFETGASIIKHEGFLKSLKADIAVSINYSGIIPESIISIFPLGILNVHGGDLPRYRGNACQAWAIINGEDKIGLCVHKMIGDELDNGDILARSYLSINVNTKILEVWKWMERTTPTLIVEAIRELELNPNYILESQSKLPSDSLRCYPRKPEDGKIDWSNSATSILRLINASSLPYSGSFCNYLGEKLIIWDAHIVEWEVPFCAVNGQILNSDINGVDVACQNGVIRITEAEYLGEKANPSRFIKSIRNRLD
jgi:UDP-4-amino-4-deoxy-L-arabinose formyltransferase/UDP-glucuronic acid dehydrogenase (UDP-4-keto-hexauronic acid decarboxylating)